MRFFYESMGPEAHAERIKYRYTVPSLFRPPPSNQSQHYAPYVCDTTADLVNKYTIPNIVALLEEVVALGTLH